MKHLHLTSTINFWILCILIGIVTFLYFVVKNNYQRVCPFNNMLLFGTDFLQLFE